MCVVQFWRDSTSVVSQIGLFFKKCIDVPCDSLITATDFDCLEAMIRSPETCFIVFNLCYFLLSRMMRGPVSHRTRHRESWPNSSAIEEEKERLHTVPRVSWSIFVATQGRWATSCSWGLRGIQSLLHWLDGRVIAALEELFSHLVFHL